MNLCEIGWFHKLWGVSKSTCDNYHEIWWKQCFFGPKYINIYEFGGYGGMYIFHSTFFVYYSKKHKKYRAWPILQSNSTSFWFNKNFVGWIIKILGKGGPRGPSPISLRSEYSSYNWLHINTPSSRHLFNTNC